MRPAVLPPDPRFFSTFTESDRAYEFLRAQWACMAVYSRRRIFSPSRDFAFCVSGRFLESARQGAVGACERPKRRLQTGRFSDVSVRRPDGSPRDSVLFHEVAFARIHGLSAPRSGTRFFP